MKKILNCCPICGSKIEYSALMQYSDIYDVLKNGKLSKNRKRKEDNGPMECGYIYCKNKECDFVTDVDMNCITHGEIEIFQENDRYCYEIKEQQE